MPSKAFASHLLDFTLFVVHRNGPTDNLQPIATLKVCLLGSHQWFILKISGCRFIERFQIIRINQDRKLVIRDPKSGKEQEVNFIPQKVAARLKEYIRAKKINSPDRIFPLCYETARAIVKKAEPLLTLPF